MADPRAKLRKQLHRLAMDLCDLGKEAREEGWHMDALEAFEAAEKLEAYLAVTSDQQPTQAILYRSAAWIAMDKSDPGTAWAYAITGLAGENVPEDIREELEEVRDAALGWTRESEALRDKYMPKKVAS